MEKGKPAITGLNKSILISLLSFPFLPFPPFSSLHRQAPHSADQLRSENRRCCRPTRGLRTTCLIATPWTARSREVRAPGPQLLDSPIPAPKSPTTPNDRHNTRHLRVSTFHIATRHLPYSHRPHAYTAFPEGNATSAGPDRRKPLPQNDFKNAQHPQNPVQQIISP